jgi:hypothetical protein
MRYIVAAVLSVLVFIIVAIVTVNPLLACGASCLFAAVSWVFCVWRESKE